MKKLKLLLAVLVGLFAFSVSANAALLSDGTNKGEFTNLDLKGTTVSGNSTKTVYTNVLYDTSGTAVATAAASTFTVAQEIVNDDILDATIAVGAEADDEIAFTVTITDHAGTTIAADHGFNWWLSTTAGAAPAATAPNVDVTVSGGISVVEHTADKVGYATTGSDGIAVITIGDTGTPSFYLNIDVGGKIYSSAVATFA